MSQKRKPRRNFVINTWRISIPGTSKKIPEWISGGIPEKSAGNLKETPGGILKELSEEFWKEFLKKAVSKKNPGRSSRSIPVQRS